MFQGVNGNLPCIETQICLVKNRWKEVAYIEMHFYTCYTPIHLYTQTVREQTYNRTIYRTNRFISNLFTHTWSIHSWFQFTSYRIWLGKTYRPLIMKQTGFMRLSCYTITYLQKITWKRKADILYKPNSRWKEHAKSLKGSSETQRFPQLQFSQLL